MPAAATVMPSPPLSPGRLSMQNISNAFVKMRQQRDKPVQIVCSSGAEPLTCPSLAAPDVVSSKRIPFTHEDQFICLNAVDLPVLLRASRATLFENAESIGANVLIDEQQVFLLIHILTSIFKSSFRWSVTISSPKYRNDGTVRVHVRPFPHLLYFKSLMSSQIRYSAHAARSERCDPRRPVALDKAISIPGLMTILERIE
jgi:hypothetical protein